MSGLFEGFDPPEGSQGWSDWHWWKIPGGKVIELILVCDGPLGYAGHFQHGRMEPCYGEGCKACKEGIGAQIRYMFGAVEPNTKRTGIWDVGRSVGLLVRDAGDRRAGMRGLWLAITHQTASRRSQTDFEVLDQIVPDWVKGIECPDRQRAIVETWRRKGIEIPDGYDKKIETAPGPGKYAAKFRREKEK